MIDKTHNHKLHLTVDSWMMANIGKSSKEELEAEGVRQSAQYGVGATLSGMGHLQLRVPGGNVWVFLEDGRVSRLMLEDHMRGWHIIKPEEEKEEDRFEWLEPRSVDTMRRGEHKL